MVITAFAMWQGELKLKYSSSNMHKFAALSYFLWHCK